MAETSSNNNNKSLYLQNSEEIEKVFNRFDTNGDGKISVTELVHVMKALGSVTLTEDEVKRMMEMEFMDTDRDRDAAVFSLEEFKAFCGVDLGNGDGGVQEVKDAFEVYDRNNDGVISPDELQQTMKNIGEECSVDDFESMIKPLDSDGDGAVNFEEFKKMITDHSGPIPGPGPGPGPGPCN